MFLYSESKLGNIASLQMQTFGIMNKTVFLFVCIQFCKSKCEEKLIPNTNILLTFFFGKNRVFKSSGKRANFRAILSAQKMP